MRRPNENLSSIARIREKFWGWLKHDRPNELLNVNSVSEATVEEALEQWCVVDVDFVNFMDAHQEEMRKDLEEEVENVCRESLQPTLLCARRLPDEDNEVMEVDLPRLVTVEHDGTARPVQAPAASQPAVENDVAMTDQEAQPPPESSAKRATMAEMLNAAVEMAQTHPEPSEAPSVSDAKKKKPVKKSVAGLSLKEVKMEKTTKIECHITKYPTAILMQNMEG